MCGRIVAENISKGNAVTTCPSLILPPSNTERQTSTDSLCTPKVNLESPVDLESVSLDDGRKPEQLEETHTGWKQNTQIHTVRRKLTRRFEPSVLWSANSHLPRWRATGGKQIAWDRFCHIAVSCASNLGTSVWEKIIFVASGIPLIYIHCLQQRGRTTS